MKTIRKSCFDSIEDALFLVTKLGLLILLLLSFSACDEPPTPTNPVYTRPTSPSPTTYILTTTLTYTPTPTGTSVPITPTHTPIEISSSTSTLTETPSPTPIPPTPTLSLVCGYGACKDTFDVLDQRVWQIRSTIGITFSVSDGALHATRPSTNTLSGWKSAGIRLAESLDFTGVNTTTVTWTMTIHPDAVSSLTYILLGDRDADRYLAFDCSVTCKETGYFKCAITLRDFSGGILDSYGLGEWFVKGRYYTFKMVSPAPRQVEFFVNGQLVYAPTFSLHNWNGIDQVQPEWLVLPWPRNDDRIGEHQCENVIHASLDYFSYQQE